VVAVSYSVTIRPGASGSIDNTITTVDSIGAQDCTPAQPLLLETADDPCVATIFVNEPEPSVGEGGSVTAGGSTGGAGPLASTGSDAAPPLLYSLVLGITGLVLLLTRARRRTDRG